MNTKNESKPTKSINRFTLAGIALTALVITVLASFAVSGTLAKFIDTVGAQSGAVPAAQFNFNEVYDVETNTFTPIVWNLDQLGATINPSYSSKIFYPGAYGDFSMDVTFISDVPAMAEVTIDLINETGAFLPTVLGRDGVTPLRDLISLNFIAIIKDRGVEPTAEEIDFANDGITVRLGEFEEKLATTLENTIGENGAYYTLGTLIEKTVYVYWKWDFELSTQGNEFDTLFGNYVNKFRDDGIESELGIGVVMIVTQDTLDGSGVSNALAPQAPNITANSAGIVITTTTITLPVVSGAEYSLDGITWQLSNEFTELDPSTQYDFYVRIKENGMVPASNATSLVLNTAPLAPSAPTLVSSTADTVTLTAIDGMLYGISTDGGANITWQSGNIFAELTPGIGYSFYTKVAQVGIVPESAPSSALSVYTTPNAPESISVASVTYNSLTLTAIDGAEYSRNGTTWQVSNIFTSLAAKTQYTFYARIKAVGSVSASEAISAQFYTTPSTPSAVATGVTDSSITLTSVVGAEYSLDGTTWQVSNVFSDLTPATAYTLRVRIAAAGNIPASDIRTINAYTSQVAPSAPTVASVTFNSVTLTAVAENEYSRNGTTWQASNIFTGLVAKTQYTFYARVKLAGSIPASPASASITAYTAPATPTASASTTTTSITATIVAGAEYSLDGTNWQVSNVFNDLTPATLYTLRVIIPASGDIPASAMSSVTIGTKPVTPEAPTISSMTWDTVTLSTMSGVVYGISSNGGANITWQASNVFTGLYGDTQYSFYTKVAANGSIPQSATSAALSITTEAYIWDGVTTIYPQTTTIDSKTYYLIYNAAELAWFRNYVNSSHSTINGKLMANIYINDTTDWQSWTDSTTGLNSWTPIGVYVAFSGNFSNTYNGNFDGNGYAVKGIYISTESTVQGLFGYAYSDASIKNLGVEDSFIKGAGSVGGVVGQTNGSLVNNSYNTGTIISSYNSAGGIVGYGDTGVQVYDCYNTGTVSAVNNYVGGIVGNLNGNTYASGIANCYNTGSVSGSSEVGGILGRGHSTTISNTYNSGSVSGSTYIGGTAGYTNAGVNLYYCHNSITLGLPTNGGYNPSYPPTVTSCLTFTNDESGLNTLLSNLNTYRSAQRAWTRDTNGVINGGLPYFVQ